MFVPRIKGFPTPSITWLKNGEPLHLENDFMNMTSSEEMVELFIKKTKFEDRGLYTLELRNDVGNAVATAELTVQGNFELTPQL